MKKHLTAEMWVVYVMTVHGKREGVNAVCEQAEWDAMELSQPGYHKLVREGITSEAEAEKLARDGQQVAELAKAATKKRPPRS